MKKLMFIMTVGFVAILMINSNVYAGLVVTGSCPVINYEDANKYYGKCVTVEGWIVSTKNTGKVCYLNFNNNWKRYLTAKIFARNYNEFHSFPERYYRDKMVRIRGYVDKNTYYNRNKPEMILNSSNQIQITYSKDELDRRRDDSAHETHKEPEHCYTDACLLWHHSNAYGPGNSEW